MRLIATAFLSMIATATALLPGGAAEAQAGNVRIEQPWARASIGTSRPAVAYLTVVNQGDDPVRLVGAESPVADRAEFHRMAKEGELMKMAPVEEIEIAAGGRVVFEPGGLHVMLVDLKQPLKRGETFPLSLRFGNDAIASATVPILGPGAMGPRDSE